MYGCSIDSWMALRASNPSSKVVVIVAIIVGISGAIASVQQVLRP